ncbi:hypothetical protein D9M71_603610 [compost metagenome]
MNGRFATGCCKPAIGGTLWACNAQRASIRSTRLGAALRMPLIANPLVMCEARARASVWHNTRSLCASPVPLHTNTSVGLSGRLKRPRVAWAVMSARHA